MADTWLSPTVVVSGTAAAISLISAGAAIWAAWVSHRMMKRQREGDRPAISCKLQQGPAGWLALQILIDNRTSTGWMAISLEVRRPKGCVAVWEWDVMRQDDYGGFALSAEMMAGASGSKARLKLEVQQEHYRIKRRIPTPAANTSADE